MNKFELVKAVSKASGITNKDTEAVLDAFVSTVKNSVAAGDNVKIVGFGTFEKHHHNARKGHNPKTGEEINIPAKDVPIFKVGDLFKEAVK